MKIFTLAIFTLSLALPLGAQAQTRLTEAQLMENAVARNICNGGKVLAARYVNETENRVSVTCQVGGAVVPGAAGLGGLGGGGAVLAGIGAAAIVAGIAGSTGSTTGTN